MSTVNKKPVNRKRALTGTNSLRNVQMRNITAASIVKQLPVTKHAGKPKHPKVRKQPPSVRKDGLPKKKAQTREDFFNGLKPEWEEFCLSYVEDYNITFAYLAAYPHVKKGSASVMGSQLIRDVRIRARIKELIQERNKRLHVSRDRIITEIANTAFNDPRKIGAKHADKNKALELLGRTEGMFEDNINVGFSGVKVQMAINLAANNAPEPLTSTGETESNERH